MDNISIKTKRKETIISFDLIIAFNIYNIAEGFFPDDRIKFPPELIKILRFGSGISLHHTVHITFIKLWR